MENRRLRRCIVAIALTSWLAATLTANTLGQPQRGPRIDLLRQKVTRSPAAQLIEMTVGPPAGSDIWQGLNQLAYISLMENQGKTVTSTTGFHVCLYGFNYRTPPLSDVNFRHALAHLMPKARIAALLGTVVPVSTKIPPSMGVWHNTDVDPHPYRPDEAEAILGYPDSLYQKVGGVWKYKTGAPLEILRVFSPLEISAPTSFTMARLFVEECHRIGLVNVQHVPADFATYLDSVYNKWDFEMFLVCYLLGRYPTSLYHEFHSSSNYPGSNNPHGIHYSELDDLLEILMFSLDHEAKIVACHRAQELIMGGREDEPLPWYVPSTDPRSQAIPIIPVYSRNFFDAMQPDLKGAVNMQGYGISNLWTYLSIYWNTPNEYRPGTTEKAVVEILDEFPERLNPLFAATTYASAFMDPVRDGLMVIHPYTGGDEPWLATGWRYYPVPGGMDVVFDLRLTDLHGQPILWQDGKPITPEDVKFIWDFLRDNQIPKYWDTFRFYDGCTIIDLDTIVAHMSTTSQWFVYVLAETAYMLPPQVWKQDPRTGAPWASLWSILGFDPSAYAYPLPGNYNPGGYTRRPLPTQLFGTGPFINVHSTATVGAQAYGDLRANDPARPFTLWGTSYSGAGYWLTQPDIQTKLAETFHSAGDVNYDGRIDTEDMALIGLAMWTSPGDKLWNPLADIVFVGWWDPPGGQVNLWDARMVSMNFGKTKTIP